MTVREDLKKLGAEGASVLILGLGKTGEAATRFFVRLGCPVSIIERRTREAYASNAHAVRVLESLDNDRVGVFFDNNIPEKLSEFSLCVISPGIPLDAEIPVRVREAGVPVMSELELGIEYSEIPSVIITGSNGKSTVVTMISELLSYPENQSYLCGNIGNPVVNLLEASASSPDCLVVEASSYQLEGCSRIKPKIGVLLNISENHLERHGSLEAYRRAKLNLFARQGEEDFAILNSDDPYVMEASGQIPSRVCIFGKTAHPACQWYATSTVIYEPEKGVDLIKVQINGNEELFDLKATQLIGEHNRYNWAAAILAARLYGAPVERVKRCISEYQGLSHRLELVSRKDNKIIINDSKSTTVASTVAAVDSVHKAFPGYNIHLLVGGKVKIGSWAPLAARVQTRKGVRISAFGGDGPIVAKALEDNGVHADLYVSMNEAVLSASASLESQEILLLSPGCASFDEFTDFEARGDAFKVYFS